MGFGFKTSWARLGGTTRRSWFEVSGWQGKCTILQRMEQTAGGQKRGSEIVGGQGRQGHGSDTAGFARVGK